MSKYLKILCGCLLILGTLQGVSPVSVYAADQREERIQQLQEKMEILKQQLAEMQKKKLREQTPADIPWQPILNLGEERIAYRQYVYLLAPVMDKKPLDASLQQIYFQASQDSLEQRGTLFVVPAYPLAAADSMSVETYNRELAREILTQSGIPTAIEGGVLVTPAPLLDPLENDSPRLFVDLAGYGLVQRVHLIEALARVRLFGEDGSIPQLITYLLKKTSPQAYRIHQEEDLIWLALDP